MDYSKMTDEELTATRKALPKYLNDCTQEQEKTHLEVYAEQKKRFDSERDDYNLEVENAGYRAGMKVSYFAVSMLGIGGILIKGTVQKRKKYYVKLDREYNGRKSAHLTKAWKMEK